MMKKLSDFKTLTFDCYGTLIDWETGLFAALQPLLARAGSALSRDAVLEAFAARESAQQVRSPSLPYTELLAVVHRQLAAEWGAEPDGAEAQAFGASVGDWPAFPDTVEALAYLKKHFKLVILSNVDRPSFKVTQARLGVKFDAIYTAQDIGSYKPSPANFAYMLNKLGGMGVFRAEVLHVAQSLFHDHVPANQIRIASAWIDRRAGSGGSGATAPVTGAVRYDFRFESLGALAAAHKAEAMM
jgi:hypothetical protein